MLFEYVLMRECSNWDHSKKYASHNTTVDWQIKTSIGDFKQWNSNFVKVDFGPKSNNYYFMVECKVDNHPSFIVGRSRDQFQSLVWNKTSYVKFDIPNFELDVDETYFYLVLTLGVELKSQYLLRLSTSNGELAAPFSLNVIDLCYIMQFSRHKEYMTFLYQCESRLHLWLYDLTNSSFKWFYNVNPYPKLEGVGYKDFVVLSQYRIPTNN